MPAANALTVVWGHLNGVPPLTVERLEDLRNICKEVDGVVTEWAVGTFMRMSIAILDVQDAETREAISAGHFLSCQGSTQHSS